MMKEDQRKITENSLEMSIFRNDNDKKQNSHIFIGGKKEIFHFPLIITRSLHVCDNNLFSQD
ncbi:hypothetical protein DERP_010167 [Dermatophagoides pteronyssinus]|uniref:Uncharacterized protein n=1 Tax=Dermatophagoides pteronyssinus TaxID=6956 RepID=A0ABQ8J7G8_DERPT|nr:hypothetical protein DERP_010167 [Dermatophagoides pteronyssinus]